MTRQDVYDRCVERHFSPELPATMQYESRLLPHEAIDAIIDCAVEEAVAIMKVKESERK